MSRFEIIVSCILFVPFVCVDAYIMYLASIFFSEYEGGDSIDFDFMACMCAMICVRLVFVIITMVCGKGRKTSQDTDDKCNIISCIYAVLSCIVLAMFLASCLVIDGNHVQIIGIPYYVAIIYIIETGFLCLVLLAILAWMCGRICCLYCLTSVGKYVGVAVVPIETMKDPVASKV